MVSSDPHHTSLVDYELTQAVLNHYSDRCNRPFNSVTDLRPHLYALPFERQKVSSLAPAIFDLAAQGHPPSLDMLASVARGVADLVASVFRRLQTTGQLPLGLWGGMFTNGGSQDLFVAPLLAAPSLAAARASLDIVPLYKFSGAECVLTRALRYHFQ